ncbi:MAG: hypothetical protein BWY81_00954 [Firmicutes bacterium ADurb.Bin467]|nr:MAG: hypothetical protein BWY81_00954 [Firmicutes bacterium ADurb.Bin467]
MCGDLQVERCSNWSGKLCSTYLIQPGEQLVIIGSVAPAPVSAFLTRVRNSVPSSRIVRSAAKFVSNTSLKPSLRSAATILPVTRVPAGRPNSSPSATRTAGATCTTVRTPGFSSASQTARFALVSFSAPTGQTTVHWPQNAQLTVPIGSPIAGEISVSKPRFCAPSTQASCTSAHAVTQRRQSMHFDMSRVMATEASMWKRDRSPSKREVSTPSCFPSA